MYACILRICIQHIHTVRMCGVWRHWATVLPATSYLRFLLFYGLSNQPPNIDAQSCDDLVLASCPGWGVSRECGVGWGVSVSVSVVWCGVVWCGVVWCGVVWCGVVWCGVVWCGVVWCGVVWCGVVRCAGWWRCCGDGVGVWWWFRAQVGYADGWCWGFLGGLAGCWGGLGGLGLVKADFKNAKFWAPTVPALGTPRSQVLGTHTRSFGHPHPHIWAPQVFLGTLVWAPLLSTPQALSSFGPPFLSTQVL